MLRYLLNSFHNAALFLQNAVLASNGEKGSIRIQFSKNPYGRKRDFNGRSVRQKQIRSQKLCSCQHFKLKEVLQSSWTSLQGPLISAHLLSKPSLPLVNGCAAHVSSASTMGLEKNGHLKLYVAMASKRADPYMEVIP